MSAATAKTTSPGLDRYKALFETCCAADALQAFRREAFAQFVSTGFPSPREEAWKYTNLRRLESRAFTPAEHAPVAIEAAQAPWIDQGGARIVFVNGRWTPALSNVAPYPPGVTVLTLGEWLKHEPAEVLEYISRTPQHPATALEHLNAAFFRDGVVVNLAPGARFEDPVHIVHLWSASAQLAMSHPRVIVRAARGSHCTLVEQYLSLGETETFTNALTSVELDAEASVRHYRFQQESLRAFHIGHANVSLREHARYTMLDLAFGASLSRLNITALLQGSGAHVELRGLFTPSGAQHIDTHTRIEHVVPHTSSEEDYRGIAEGRGRGVFNGKVLVHPGAQKTDARQSSRNLLLSATAEIDAKPELEIYANDVKCSHGSTTGQLDATALFYLRSRGLSEHDARALLIRAFSETILASIPNKRVHDYLEGLLAARFGAPRGQS